VSSVIYHFHTKNMKNLLLFLSFFFVCNASVFSDEKEYDFVVDRNGRGDFRNIQEAFDAVRAFDPKGTVTIFIREGIYKEKLVVPTHVCDLKIVGENKDRTIITYDDHANINAMGTFKT